MSPNDVKRIVRAELDKGTGFENWHGITPENIEAFLVDPYQARVDPDDLETTPRPMWVVLHERQKPRDGYVVVFDPLTESWGVAEFTGDPELTMVIGADSFSAALEGM